MPGPGVMARILAAAIALVCAFCASGCGSGTNARAPAPTSTATPQGSPGPSQSAVDAGRDGVPASIASLPFDERVEDKARIRTLEGFWVISRPSGGDKAETDDYEEILLLDIGETTILRAYPLPSVPPDWITVGDQAVYCGREGDGDLRYAMVCRIDRKTLAATVRIFTDRLDTWRPSDHPTWWQVEPFRLEMSEFAVDGVAVWSKTRTEGWTRLDPVTLTIVDRGTAGPQTSPAPRVSAEPT